MRVLTALLLFNVSIALAAEVPDGLATARGFAAAGAVQLALDRVVRAQPGEPAAPGWGDWEVLRIELLGRLERHPDVLARVAAVPPILPPGALLASYRVALRAAVALGRGAETRKYAARLLWQHELSAGERRGICLIVIESYVADDRGGDAFLSMLRFEQDYRPLPREIAARFVSGLIDLGMARQAVNWLASLDDGGSLKLRLRFKAGLIDAAAALAQARALVGRNGGIDAWLVVADAALERDQRAQQVEALEQVLHALNTSPGAIAVRARELWQAYELLARETANRNRLLTGDDAGWGDFGVRGSKSEPVAARAIFGHLARHASSLEIRQNALFRLVGSLRGAKLGRAGLRLVEAAGLDIAAIDRQTRYALGDIADSSNEPALALRYWQDLPPPAGSSAEDWLLRVAAAAIHGGRPEAAAVALKRGLESARKLDPALVQRGIQIAQKLLAAGRNDDAAGLFDALLPLAEPAQQWQILLGLARIHEASGQWAAAADYYLRSAMLADPKAPDALALHARLAAALALARAGYAGDARAQLDWLLKHSKDPAQLEIARRELARLKH